MAQTPLTLNWTSAEGDTVAAVTLSSDSSDPDLDFGRWGCGGHGDTQPGPLRPSPHQRCPARLLLTPCAHWNCMFHFLQWLLLCVHSSVDRWRPRPRLPGCWVRTRLPRQASPPLTPPLLAPDFQLRTSDSSFRTSTSRPSSGYELASCPHCGISGTREARGEGERGTAVGGAIVTRASVRSAISWGQPAGSPGTPVPSTTALHRSPRKSNNEQF